MTRRTLLARHGIQLPDHLGDAGEAGPDDVLDAAAAAWSAQRIATGHASRLPTQAPPAKSTSASSTEQHPAFPSTGAGHPNRVGYHQREGPLAQ